MSLDTFANLKNAIEKHLDRDDLTDAAPDNFVEDFIVLAETRHKREVRFKEMITRVAITVNARQIAFPTRHLETLVFRILTTPVTLMTFMSIYELTRVRREVTGTPKYYSETSEFEFDVSPASSFSGEIVYYQAQVALSDSNTTNDLLTRAPDAYLYAALTASAPFLLDDSRIAVWNSLYKNAVKGLKDVDSKSKPGPQISRVFGATP